MRNTKIRKSTEKVLGSTQKPLSVPEIIEKLRSLKVPANQQAVCSANKTTIYRILKSLINQEVVLELDFGEGKKRYESNNGHHHHLICKRCNKVEHIRLDEIEITLGSSQEKILQQNNFKITDHTIELFGLCGGCR